MKKLTALLLILIIFAPAKIFVKGVDLIDIEEHYIELEINYAYKVKKYYAYVHYGQEGKYRDRVVVDKNGDKREFGSKIKVLNTFYKNGWEIKLKDSYYKDWEINTKIGSSNEVEGGSLNRKTIYILERRAEK